MITGILIILTFAVNCILLVYIRQEQKDYHNIIFKVQDDQWEDLIQIGRTVRAIDKKIEDSTVYKTELRFMDNKEIDPDHFEDWRTIK